VRLHDDFGPRKLGYIGNRSSRRRDIITATFSAPMECASMC